MRFAKATTKLHTQLQRIKKLVLVADQQLAPAIIMNYLMNSSRVPLPKFDRSAFAKTCQTHRNYVGIILGVLI